MTDRTNARSLFRQYADAGDPNGWFEALYAAAGDDPAVIPWADQRPNPNVTRWLDRNPQPVGVRALVVGCGLGDDAEELARRGLIVTAFDIAPSAVGWCRRRFPASAVEYAVADVLDPPATWRGGFDLVQESYTLQALPPTLRERAIKQVAAMVAPRGTLLVVCRGREPEDDAGQSPWPLTRAQLDAFVTEEKLVAESFEDYLDEEDPPVRRFRCAFRAKGSGASDPAERTCASRPPV